MTVAVFVLRQGKRLPLHDHPRMFGLLKVVHGKLKINTYSPLKMSDFPVPPSLQHRLATRYGRNINVYPARFEGSKICSETDECSVITPDGNSIHEIHAESGTAAFLDVLSPPYSYRNDAEHRPCNYYSEIDRDQTDSSIRYLVRINAPGDYWCDEANYSGPKLPVPP